MHKDPLITSTSANQIRLRIDTQYPIRNMEHKSGTRLAAADRDGSDNRRSEILTDFKIGLRHKHEEKLQRHSGYAADFLILWFDRVWRLKRG